MDKNASTRRACPFLADSKDLNFIRVEHVGHRIARYVPCREAIPIDGAVADGAPTRDVVEAHAEEGEAVALAERRSVIFPVIDGAAAYRQRDTHAR